MLVAESGSGFVVCAMKLAWAWVRAQGHILKKQFQTHQRHVTSERLFRIDELEVVVASHMIEQIYHPWVVPPSRSRALAVLLSEVSFPSTKAYTQSLKKAWALRHKTLITIYVSHHAHAHAHASFTSTTTCSEALGIRASEAQYDHAVRTSRPRNIVAAWLWVTWVKCVD